MKAACILLMTAALVSAADWSPLGTWQGTGGAKETETFQTSGKEWRVRWTATKIDAGQDRTLRATVYDADSDRIVSMVSAGAEDTGESFVRGKGRYYLKIATYNAKWAIVAEEAR